jgi:hypothetical protein
MQALHLKRWYLGIAFGEQVSTHCARSAHGVGAMTKASRRGQKFDADGRGSDVVACCSQVGEGRLGAWSNRGCDSAVARQQCLSMQLSGRHISPIQDGASFARCRRYVNKGGGAWRATKGG